MVQFRSANLRDVVSRPAVTRKPIYAPVENAFRSDTRKRIEQLNDFMQARASNQAGASAPTPSVRGELWADTSTAGAVTLYVDPDGEGFDDNIATRLTAKAISFKGPGTSQTFKPGGAIDVNTTRVTGALMTYAMPGGTLAADGQIIESVLAMADVTGGIDVSIAFQLNAGNVMGFAGDAGATDAVVRTIIVRTAADTVKTFGFRKNNLDSTGDTTLVDGIATASVTLSSAVTIGMGTASPGDASEFMLTRYLP